MEITDKEKEAILAYQGFNYKLFNSILEVDMSAEVDYIRNSSDKAQTFTQNEIEELIENIKLIYSAMMKYSHNKHIGTVYRGTSQSDIDRINNRKSINKFLSTTFDQNMARGFFSLTWDNPAFIRIQPEDGVPFLDIGAVIEDYGENGEREILLSPFLDVSELNYVRSEPKSTENGLKNQKLYIAKVKKGELPDLTEEDYSLKNEILESAESISEKQTRYFKVIKEIEEVEAFMEINKEKIEKTKRDLANPIISQMEKKGYEDDLEYFMTSRTEELKSTYDRLQKEKQVLGNEIENWKKKVVRLCKVNCRAVEKDIKLQIEQEKEESERRREEAKVIKEQKMIARMENTYDLHSTTCKTVSLDVDRTENNVSKVLSFKNKLESVSKDMGISYISYIDTLRNVPSSINTLRMRLKDFSKEMLDMSLKTGENLEGSFLKSEEVRDACEGILDICSNMQGIPVSKLMDLEEEAFKHALSNKVLDIKLEIFAKVLKDEYMQLKNIRGIKKVFYKLTGKDKANEMRKTKLYESVREMVEQRKKIRAGIRVEEKVSMHQILADIKLLEAEYGKEPEFAKEVTLLENLRNVILGEKMKGIYKGIDEGKADKIANSMKQSRLPVVDGKNINKSDLIMNEVRVLTQKEHKTPPEQMRFNIEQSIRKIGDFMRNVINDRSRTKEAIRGVDR